MIWPFSIWTKQRKEDKEFYNFRTAEAHRTDRLIRDGWRHVTIDQPPPDAPVMFTRDGDTTFIQAWEQLPPEYDVHNLWWHLPE